LGGRRHGDKELGLLDPGCSSTILLTIDEHDPGVIAEAFAAALLHRAFAEIEAA
jgi:hypothetical protein